MDAVMPKTKDTNNVRIAAKPCAYTRLVSTRGTERVG
jgi:hypothetical protein